MYMTTTKSQDINEIGMVQEMTYLLFPYFIMPAFTVIHSNGCKMCIPDAMNTIKNPTVVAVHFLTSLFLMFLKM